MVKDNDIKNKIIAFENDIDFLALIEKYEAPNCVSIMGKTRREEWHSNFVNWILDPKAHHDLGTFVLEKFLDLIESKDRTLKFNREDLDKMYFETEKDIFEARKGRIDILGTNNHMILVIENKIKAKENDCQSNLYYNYFEKDVYNNKQKCYIHLSSDPKTRLVNENFIFVSYQELFDYVLKPAYERCIVLDKTNTKIVLEEYLTDISNPFLDHPVMAYTEKERARKIYQAHKETIQLIGKTMGDFNRDKESDVCVFFEKYEKYINELILKPIGEPYIIPEIGKKLEGQELIMRLCIDGYVIPGETELRYKRHKKTFVIRINKNYKCSAGYYDIPDYYGTEEPINFLMEQEFDDIHQAAVDIEWEVNPHPSKTKKEANGGKTPYKMFFVLPGRGVSENKTIMDLYPSWFK